MYSLCIHTASTSENVGDSVLDVFTLGQVIEQRRGELIGQYLSKANGPDPYAELELPQEVLGVSLELDGIVEFRVANPKTDTTELVAFSTDHSALPDMILAGDVWWRSRNDDGTQGDWWVLCVAKTGMSVRTF